MPVIILLWIDAFLIPSPLLLEILLNKMYLERERGTEGREGLDDETKDYKEPSYETLTVPWGQTTGMTLTS